MQQGTVNEMAAQFTAAYLELKEKKTIEKLLSIIKPLILSAKTDGISDKELIELINSLGLKEKFYPAKLKDLRARLGRPDQGESEMQTQDDLAESAPPCPISVASSDACNGAVT